MIIDCVANDNRKLFHLTDIILYKILYKTAHVKH